MGWGFQAGMFCTIEDRPSYRLQEHYRRAGPSPGWLTLWRLQGQKENRGDREGRGTLHLHAPQALPLCLLRARGRGSPPQ